jgi:hypothetical protein
MSLNLCCRLFSMSFWRKVMHCVWMMLQFAVMWHSWASCWLGTRPGLMFNLLSVYWNCCVGGSQELEALKIFRNIDENTHTGTSLLTQFQVTQFSKNNIACCFIVNVFFCVCSDLLLCVCLCVCVCVCVYVCMYVCMCVYLVDHILNSDLHKIFTGPSGT